MISGQEIKIESTKILDIYEKYTAIHEEADKLKRQIVDLEDKLMVFSDLADNVRTEEVEFYKSIAEKYNVTIDDVKSFVTNILLKLKGI